MKSSPAFIQRMNETAAAELDQRLATNPQSTVLLIQRASSNRPLD